MTVRPCREVAEALASVWVVDPDTPVEELTLHVDDAHLAGVSVEGKIRRVPWASSYGHVGAAELVVRVAPWARGDYTIPIIVSDPDGGSSSAVLTVRVVGNRPPEARGALEREAVVELLPSGLQARPVGFLVELRDPDGDPVVVQGLGRAPERGAVNYGLSSRWLGVVYTPQGVGAEEACAAATGRGGMADEFTLLLGDGCTVVEVPYCRS